MFLPSVKLPMSVGGRELCLHAERVPKLSSGSKKRFHHSLHVVHNMHHHWYYAAQLVFNIHGYGQVATTEWC